MLYFLEDFPTLSLEQLQNELARCEGMTEEYESKYPPILENYGYEESDEVSALQEYIEGLIEAIDDERHTVFQQVA